MFQQPYILCLSLNDLVLNAPLKDEGDPFRRLAALQDTSLRQLIRQPQQRASDTNRSDNLPIRVEDWSRHAPRADTHPAGLAA